MNGLPVAHGGGVLQSVFELANVARPVVGQKGPHGRRRESLCASTAPADLVEQMGDEQIDVLTPLAKGTESDGDHVQSIVQIGTKTPLSLGDCGRF